MAFLTKEQIEKLIEAIRRNATWLTWRLLGSQYITETDLAALKAQGLLPMDITADTVRQAFVLGQLESVLKEAEWKNLTWEQAMEAATTKQTPVNELQIRAAGISFFSKLRGLEDEIREGLFDQISRATQGAIDESTVREKIRQIVTVGVEADKNYRQVANDFRETLKETKRNWHRVAATELHSARQNGVVSAIITGTDVYKDAQGVDSDVAVTPNPDACDDCKRIYLDPKTGNPRIFKLSELLGNAGTNYIRPWRKNAKPVVPPLHPHCFCRVRYVPRGWGYDDKGKFTLLDTDKFIESVTKKSNEGLEDMQKAQPNELLHTASNLMPTDEDIQSLSTKEDLVNALDRIEALKKLHISNHDLWHELDALERKVLFQSTQVLGGSGNEQ